MASKALATVATLTPRERRRADKQARQEFIRDTVVQALGKGVELVQAQPYIALVAGYLTVHAMEKAEVLGNTPATALKTLTLVTAAAPAGWQAVVAAMAFGTVQGVELAELEELAKSTFDAVADKPAEREFFKGLTPIPAIKEAIDDVRGLFGG